TLDQQKELAAPSGKLRRAGAKESGHSLYWTAALQGCLERVNHAAVLINSFVYSFGGFSGNRRTIFANCVELMYTDKPLLRYGHTVVQFDGCAYMFGGRNTGWWRRPGVPVRPISLAWTIHSGSGQVPPSRDGHSAAWLTIGCSYFGGFTAAEGIRNQPSYRHAAQSVEYRGPVAPRLQLLHSPWRRGFFLWGGAATQPVTCSQCESPATIPDLLFRTPTLNRGVSEARWDNVQGDVYNSRVILLRRHLPFRSVTASSGAVLAAGSFQRTVTPAPGQACRPCEPRLTTPIARPRSGDDAAGGQFQDPQLLGSFPDSAAGPAPDPQLLGQVFKILAAGHASCTRLLGKLLHPQLVGRSLGWMNLLSEDARRERESESASVAMPTKTSVWRRRSCVLFDIARESGMSQRRGIGCRTRALPFMSTYFSGKRRICSIDVGIIVVLKMTRLRLQLASRVRFSNRKTRSSNRQYEQQQQKQQKQQEPEGEWSRSVGSGGSGGGGGVSGSSSLCLKLTFSRRLVGCRRRRRHSRRPGQRHVCFRCWPALCRFLRSAHRSQSGRRFCPRQLRSAAAPPMSSRSADKSAVASTVWSKPQARATTSAAAAAGSIDPFVRSAIRFSAAASAAFNTRRKHWRHLEAMQAGGRVAAQWNRFIIRPFQLPAPPLRRPCNHRG
uniref:RING-type domain-containing protein n=1 Tax=Macrostomum lignano TaxID=282301 RepID=A0A1I8FC70_9PLAT